MKKFNFYKKFIIIILVILVIPFMSMFFSKNDDRNTDGHKWKWVDEYYTTRTAYSSDGSTITHDFCRGCDMDLTALGKSKPWINEPFDIPIETWEAEYLKNDTHTARVWHEKKYGCWVTNTEPRPYELKFKIPGHYECELCKENKYKDGSYFPALYQGGKYYDINGNYLGEMDSTHERINWYCLQNGLTPKYYEHYSAVCSHYSGDDDETTNIISGDKVYDKNGKLITGPNLVTVREKSSYIQVFVKSDGTILKSAYFECNGYLYNSDSFGGVSLKLTTLAITYNNKLYSSDGAGKATLIKNKTVTINGYAYISDENGNVTNNTGGSSPGQTDDGSWQNDPVNNPSGSGYKKEYRNGIWYDSNGKASSTYRSGHWTSDSKGWWYQDGSYFPVSSWVKIDGYWYYFCADGYMDYSEYREGCWLNADGSWNESYSGGHWNEWSPGSGWWWYTDNTGYYPNGGSCWIDGHQYQFDAEGWTYSK